MARYCDACQRSYADDLPTCPYCPSPTLRNGERQQPEGQASSVPPRLRRSESSDLSVTGGPEAEIDLGGPIQQRGNADSGSVDSVNSWISLLQTDQPHPTDDPEPPLRIGTPTPLPTGDPSLKLNPPPDAGNANEHRSSAANSDATIDLGSPVFGGTESTGPPSGASFYSWAALLESKSEIEDYSPASNPSTAPSSSPAAPSGQPAVTPAAVQRDVAPRQSNRVSYRTGGLVLGVLLGSVLCLALWFAGVEPPQTWRDRVRQWLGQEPAPAVPDDQAPTVSQPSRNVTP
ncbi:MAG: hypothetical protein ACK4RK_02520 [Gemmataceae bacterium]